MLLKQQELMNLFLCRDITLQETLISGWKLLITFYVELSPYRGAVHVYLTRQFVQQARLLKGPFYNKPEL